MSNYKLENFVREAKSTDNLVTIYKSNDLAAFTINPLSVIRTLVQNNIVKITTNKDVYINLDFTDNNEARLALVELQRQFDIIRKRATEKAVKQEKAVEQVSSATDFNQIYDDFTLGLTQSGGTSSGTSSATASNIDNRIINFVRNVGQDILSINKQLSELTTKKQERIVEKYKPITKFIENNYPQDIIGITFEKESEGPASLTINGIGLYLGDSTQSTAFLSNDNLQTATSSVTKGSVLYINTSLLGYEIDTNDVIGIEYISK